MMLIFTIDVSTNGGDLGRSRHIHRTSFHVLPASKAGQQGRLLEGGDEAKI
jgi:hypothetical protein